MYDTGRWPDSWWRASAPAWEGPAPLDGDAEAEVAIIGGGYAGLACAIRLAECGIGALVLDAGPVGWGASGRNGGMVGLGSHKLSMAALVRRHGAAEVDRYRASQVEGNARLRAFCETRGVPVQGRGEMLLAHSAAAFRELARRTAPPGGAYEVIEPRSTNNAAGRHGALRRAAAQTLFRRASAAAGPGAGRSCGGAGRRRPPALGGHGLAARGRTPPSGDFSAVPSGPPGSCWRRTGSRRTGCTRPSTGGRCR